MPYDVKQPIFAERLWPSAGIWTAAIALGAGFGLIPAPISVRIAVVCGLLAVLVLVGLLVLTTPKLILTSRYFVAGRARVPVELIGEVEVLTAEQMRQARGISLDARAYLSIRGWLPLGVKVMLDDPADPTPYWLVSSRRPEALASAISRMTGAAAAQQG